MYEKFNDLLESLNNECLARLDEDLSLLESSMSEVLDAWTDYMMSHETAPSDVEFKMYHKWLNLANNW